MKRPTLGRLLTAVAALALLLGGFGLLQNTAQAQAVGSITVGQNYLCSGGDACELSTADGTAEIDSASNPGDNLLSITFANVETIKLKVGSRSKTFGGDGPDGVAGNADDPPRLDTTPLEVAVVDKATTTDYQFQAFSGNVITVEYTVATGDSKARFEDVETVTVDNFAPSIITDSPELTHITKTTGGTRVTFSATFTDTLAGFSDKVSGSGTLLRFGPDPAAPAQPQDEVLGGRVDLIIGDDDAGSPAPLKVPLKASHFTAVDNGWRVSWSTSAAGLKPFIGDADVGKIPWHFEAVDRAGNIARSDGSVKDTTTEAGNVTGTSARVEDFGSGGYTDGTFVARRIKITTTATTAATAATVNGVSAAYATPTTAVAADATANPPIVASCEGKPTVAGDFTVKQENNANVDWTVGAVSATRTVETFTATAQATGASTFTWVNVNDGAIMAKLTLQGTVDHDSDPATDDVDCTFVREDVIAVPKDATIEVLNTRSITLDDVAPVLDTLETGKAWKASADKGKRLQTGTSAKRNSIMLGFDDQSGLDASTVTNSAFSVAGNTVMSVLLIDSSKETDDDNVEDLALVFLTLGEDLGPSDTPKVSLAVGVIKDKAGNAMTEDVTSLSTTDRLGPALTLSSSAALSKDTITITIEADEDLAGLPELWTTKVTTDNDALIATRTDADKRTTEASGSLRRFTARHAATSENSGEYNVFVKGEDTTGANPGEAGNADPTNSAAFTYELDKKLNAGEEPKVAVSNRENVQAEDTPPTVETISPMIVTVDYGMEGNEYPGDSYKKVTLTSATLKVTFADGLSDPVKTFDLATEVSSPDSIRFTIPILNPKVGTYALTVKAEDEAGNATGTNDHVIRWKVGPSQPVTIDLKPGWNLISLPFQPANPAINSVIPNDHPISLVMTYDSAEGVWLFSRRDAETGMFTGDVSVITATSGYFVNTDSFKALSLLRPPLGTSAAAPAQPPAISVTAGWNLVPVSTNQTPVPKGIDADIYFGTLGDTWLRALAWNPLARVWITVSPSKAGAPSQDTEALNIAPGTKKPDRCGRDHENPSTATANINAPAQVCTGQGLWLWVTEDGTLIPG